jgi:hypothetical protein
LTQLVLAAVLEPDALLGLPCFVFYSREFQLLFRVWAGCYNGLANQFGISQNECEFLFRWFQQGGVLDDEEIEGILAIAIKFGARIGMSRRGWSALAEFFKFSSQQGRVMQPWGVRCMKWIISHRL